MIPDRLLVHSATWLVAGTGTDPYGNTTPDWDRATSASLRCRVDPRPGSETDDEQRDALVATALLLCNETRVAGRDRLVVGSVTWEVDGPPRVVPDGVGAHHLEADLRQVAG